MCVCVVHTLILTEACLCKVLSQRMIQVSCFRGHSSSGGGHGNSGEDWAGRNCFRLTAIWVERVLCYLSCMVIKSSSIWLVHLLFNSGPDLTSILYAFVITAIHATCPAYLIPLGFMILMFVKSTNYKAPQPVMPTILGSNIVLRTLFSHVLSLCPSIDIKNHTSHPQMKTKM
jgi:hypothetical protein